MIAALVLLLASAALDDADTAMRAGELGRCDQLAVQALASGALEEQELARAWLLRGRCFELSGDNDRAERSYAVAVQVSAVLPAWISRGAAPNDEGALAAALRARAADPLRAQARVVEDHVEIELLADELSLVRSASLCLGDDEQARLPLALGAASTHRVAGIATTGLSLRLHDKHGNVLWRGPVDVASPPGPTNQVLIEGGSPAREPTVLTTLGAAALGVGLVGAVACGIGASADGAVSLDRGSLWLVGVGASTGVFLIGAALVVVDQSP